MRRLPGPAVSRLSEGDQTPETLFELFRDCQRTQIQSSATALRSLRQQMDVRFCESRNHQPRGKRAQRKFLIERATRSPEREKQTCAFPLTKTYMEVGNPEMSAIRKLLLEQHERDSLLRGYFRIAGHAPGILWVVIIRLILMHGELAKQDSSTDSIPSGGICYLFGVLFPLLYLLSRRRNQQSTFLRFHCIQCLILFMLWVPFILWRIGPTYISSIAFLLGLVGWLVAMSQAKRRKLFHLPLIGWAAERLT
jgi:uncharacterized membrane protein